jgi:XRE family aerobic/anaerobic benzoate catabolism transcriptional regulator
MDQKTVTRIIGDAVRANRTAAAMSRRKLAEVADVSERYLNELERGNANVSVGVLARIATALNVDFTELLPAPLREPAQSAADNAPSPIDRLVAGMTLREQQQALPILQQFLDARRKSERGIALLGLRGAGKSTVGKMYATRHGLPFISVTREIEARAGMNLNDLFNLGGSEAYRMLENDVVHALAERNDRIVLEAAGGIVGNREALEVIFGSFRTIWLKAAPEEHLLRVAHQGDMRPMLGVPKAIEQLKALLQQREQEYARADHVLDTSGRSPDEVVAELERIA